MDKWPLNILVYTPPAEQHETARRLLRAQPDLHPEHAFCDRFLLHWLDSERFHLLVVFEPQQLDQMMFLWRARRHSRFNLTTPMLVMASGDRPAFISILNRFGVAGYLPLPANEAAVRKAVFGLGSPVPVRASQPMATAHRSHWHYPVLPQTPLPDHEPAAKQASRGHAAVLN